MFQDESMGSGAIQQNKVLSNTDFLEDMICLSRRMALSTVGYDIF